MHPMDNRTDPRKNMDNDHRSRDGDLPDATKHACHLHPLATPGAAAP
jgi:hypothetical protein